MYPKIKDTCQSLCSTFDSIPQERIEILTAIARPFAEELLNSNQLQVIYICTHNSRRSHFAQIWSEIASHYFHINRCSHFSGGTEVTRINQHVLAALAQQGFDVQELDDSTNPSVAIRYGDDHEIVCYSKTYDDRSNPQSDFIAVMTCDHADENCPFIPGAKQRIPLTYEDPKKYDQHDNVVEKYKMKSAEIGREMLYLFSLIEELLSA
jgi:arsenate reductase (thioredoxin)